MILPLILSAGVVCTSPGGVDPAPAPTPADTVVAIFGSGVDFPTFLEGTRARREMWHEIRASASVDPTMVERARASGPGWRVLAVAEDSCSDSVNSLPYLAVLVEQLVGVELRVVTSGPGRPVMERYRSPDGRASTPTVVLLDPSGDVVGCWVEQPAALQAWWLDPDPSESPRVRTERKMEWYAADGGRETIRELVEMLEGAAAGRPTCRAGPTG
jgi:hypothetical protein